MNRQHDGCIGPLITAFVERIRQTTFQKLGIRVRIGGVLPEVVMPALILNDFGDPDAKLSSLRPENLRGDYAKVAVLLFDHVVECSLYTPHPGPSAGIVMSIEPGPRIAYSGRHIEFLYNHGEILSYHAGFDDTLQAFIEDRHAHFERKKGLDCLIHPAFLNQNKKPQPALSIRFLDEAVVPTVPIKEVIDFRNHHTAELSAFWAMVYRAAEDPTGILKNNPEAKIRRELDAALSELEHAQVKGFGGRILQGFEMTIGLSINAIAALAAYQFGYSPVGDLLSSSGVSMSLERRLGREPSERAKATTFIRRARRELQKEAPKRPPFDPIERAQGECGK